MSKNLKLALKLSVIILTFALIFYGNIWLQEYFIRIASNAGPCTAIDIHNLNCVIQPFRGVGALYMYYSAALFTFISIMLFKSNKRDLIIIFILPILYIVLSELVIQIFNFPVLYKGVISGRYSSDNTLYFFNGPTTVLAILLTIVASSIAGTFAIILKRFLYKSPSGA